jgi:mRNA interferase RelE/StbE
MDYLEPLEGAPHQKLRIGPFHLRCRAARSEQILYGLTITKREGDAYRGNYD